MEPYIYKTKVEYRDLDYTKKMSHVAYFSYFQEAAHLHANELGCGYKTLLKQNIAWVLARIKFEFKKPVYWEDFIYIKTWPVKYRKYDAKRDLIFVDENENVIALGTSKWLLMDLDTRKMKPLSSIDLPKVCDANDALIQKKEKRIKDIEYKHVYSYEVRLGDIDTNRHMNNTKYMELMLNAFSQEQRASYSLKEVCLEFKKEAKFGDILDILVAKISDEKLLLEIRKEESEICSIHLGIERN